VTSICEPGVRWPVLREYQKHRVCTLLDPTRDPLGKGFHIIQGMIAIGSGGLTGKGFMQPARRRTWSSSPSAPPTSSSPPVCEEFGLAGVLLLMAGFLFLIFRGLLIAAEAPTLFARLLAGAVTLSLFTYAFVNMGMVSGILPVVGVPLPFVSYGGTAMVTLGLALGILMSVARARSLMQRLSSLRRLRSRGAVHLPRAVSPAAAESRLGCVRLGSRSLVESSAFEGKAHREQRAGSHALLGGHGARAGIDDLQNLGAVTCSAISLHDGQAQAAAVDVGAQRPVERAEHSSRSARGMPGPVSSTCSTTTCPNGSGITRTVTVPPAGVYCSALSTRLRTSSRISSGWPAQPPVPGCPACGPS
jgi:hypothetical protein